MPHDLHSLQRNGGGAHQQRHLCVGRETTRRATVALLVLSLTFGFLSVVTESTPANIKVTSAAAWDRLDTACVCVASHGAVAGLLAGLACL